MKKVTVSVTIALVLILAVACSQQVKLSTELKPGDIFRHYFAMKTGSGDTYVTVKFLANTGMDAMNNPFGIPVELSGTSSITFNGQPMELKKNIFGDIEYKLSLKEWPFDFTWKWMDNNGEEHTDTFRVEEIDLPLQWMKRSDGKLHAVWNGSPVRQNEEVSIRIKQGKQEWVFKTTQPGADRVYLEEFSGKFVPMGGAAEIRRLFSIREGYDMNSEIEKGLLATIVYNEKAL